MSPSYPTTKKFIGWLAEVRPEYEIKSDKKLDDREYYPSLGGMQNGLTRVKFVTYGVPLITTDTLYAILWELFKCENPEYTHMIKTGIRNPDQWIIRTFADALWIKYTSGNPSMWHTNPDEVLEDIMKNYIEFNK